VVYSTHFLKWSIILKRWQFWLGVAISAFLMWWTLRNFRLADIWETVQHANYWWIIPGVVVYFGAVWARTWRWHYLLRPLKHIPLNKLFPIVTIGYMANNITPARAGELVRAYVLKRKENVSVSASLATIIVERIFDGIVMLIFVLVALPLAPTLPDWLRQVVILGSVAFFGALIVFLVLASAPKRFAAVYNWMVSRFVPTRLRPGVVGILDRFVEGLACLRSPLDLLMIFVTSLVIWLTETVKYWFVMHAFAGHGFPVSFFTLMLMNGVVNLATTIPSAPGYVGTFDTPGIEILKASGVEGATAAGYTLVLHAALWLPITLLGAWYLAREGLQWSDFRQAEQLRQASSES
jgi:uncharacterized protein (TIRG00374 family)